MAKGINFAVECDWNSKISRNVENLFFLKKMGFSREYLVLFCEMDKGSKVAAESNESVWFLDKLDSKNRWFLRKRNLNFWKQLNLANLMSTAPETVSQFDVECERNSEVSQNSQNMGFLQEKMGFTLKILKFLKLARGIIFAVESNWKSEISQNVQTFGCYKTFTRVLQKILKLIVTEIGSFLKRCKEFELLYKNR